MDTRTEKLGDSALLGPRSREKVPADWEPRLRGDIVRVSHYPGGGIKETHSVMFYVSY